MKTRQPVSNDLDCMEGKTNEWGPVRKDFELAISKKYPSAKNTIFERILR